MYEDHEYINVGKLRIPEEMIDGVPIFLERRISELEELESFVQKNNYAAIREITHKIKGTSAIYGFPELGELAKEMTLAAVEQDISRLTKSYQQLKQRVLFCHEEFDEFGPQAA